VVGYDDIFGSDFCHPPLTTVSSPVERAGRAVVDLLLGAVVAHPGLVLPADLRVRDSTGPAPR
jgi:DNA-binding LacI/PurR family transcriptional regulator